MSKKVTKKLVIANWKMNPISQKEAEKLFTNIAKSIQRIKKTEIVICPPYLYLEKIKKNSRKIIFGAQDAFWGTTGPFTGEISAEMLFSVGARYVILGHSERRALGEKNTEINKKIKGVFSAGLTPVLCVGDVERDENHEYFNFVKVQIEECLAGISKELVSRMIVAYEPVWAISTTPDRKNETKADFLEMAIFIRKVLTDKIGAGRELPKIIYGGSVNDKNISEFMEGEGIDGVLVGGASLDPKKFLEIINVTEHANN